MKRFVVRLEFYIHADTDTEAKRIADNMAEDQRYHNDNDCQVVSIYEQPFGALGNRAVFDVED